MELIIECYANYVTFYTNLSYWIHLRNIINKFALSIISDILRWKRWLKSFPLVGDQGPVSISDETSCRKISGSLESAKFVFRIDRSLRKLTVTSAVLLPRCLSNFKAMRPFIPPILLPRDLKKSYDKTSCRILKRAQGPYRYSLLMRGIKFESFAKYLFAMNVIFLQKQNKGLIKDPG